MKVKPQSLLFLSENVPNYIHYGTRSRVLYLYRMLHRNLSYFEDVFTRNHLRFLAQTSFARYKYITETDKINALLDFFQNNELQWILDARRKDAAAIAKLFELAFTTYRVQPFPLRKLLAISPTICDRKSIVYRINNARMPAIRTFKEHMAKFAECSKMQLRDIDHEFWTFHQILERNNLKKGLNKRKVPLRLEDLSYSDVTALGKPIAPSRQKNILRKFYNKILEDSFKPVHPEILNHVMKQLSNQNLSRIYRRRLQILGVRLFTINKKDYSIIKIPHAILKNIPFSNSGPIDTE